MERSLRDITEILETMCAPEAVDAPREIDFIPRTIEDEIMDDIFIRSWVAKRQREMR